MTKTWLITGSSRGFGWELARSALDHGDHVVATARRSQQLDGLRQEYGGKVRTVSLDVTDPDAARAAVQTAVDQFGTLDVVVNNAGYANSAPIEEMDDGDFRAQIETNLFGVVGVVNVTKAALRVLHKQRFGHFLQFSSIGGRVGGSPGLSAYQAAKFAVEGFSEVLNAEVKPLGIKVTIIEPDGLGRFVDGHVAGERGLRADCRGHEPLPRVHCGHVAGRPKASGADHPRGRRHGGAAPAAATGRWRSRGRGQVLAGARRGSRKVGGGQPVCRLPAGRIAPILPLPPYRRAGQRHPQLFVAGAQEYDVLSEGVKPGKSGSVAPTTPSTYGSRNADGRSETERRACGDVGS